jgi:hypothetical protein
LVKLAHAVIPPERRSGRPVQGKPTELATVAPKPRPKASPERRANRVSLTGLSDATSSELRWGRALLLTGALLAGVGAVAMVANRWKQAPVATSIAPAPKHNAVAEQPVALDPEAANHAADHATNHAPNAAESAPPPTAVSSPATPAAALTVPVEKTASSAPVVAVAPAAPHKAPLSAPAPSAAGVEKTGSVQLSTKNGRAEVYLGSKLLGVTPLTLDLPVGSASLLLKPIDGGEPRAVSVAIQPGAASFITVPLSVPAHVANE